MDGHNPISAEMSSHNLTSKEVCDSRLLISVRHGSNDPITWYVHTVLMVAIQSLNIDRKLKVH